MIIIKYFEWLKIRLGERISVYELCKKDPKDPDGYKAIKRLDRVTVEDIIDKYGLVLVHENSYGQIWEGGPEELPEDDIEEEIDISEIPALIAEETSEDKFM